MTQIYVTLQGILENIHEVLCKTVDKKQNRWGWDFGEDVFVKRFC